MVAVRGMVAARGMVAVAGMVGVAGMVAVRAEERAEAADGAADAAVDATADAAPAGMAAMAADVAADEDTVTPALRATSSNHISHGPDQPAQTVLRAMFPSLDTRMIQYALRASTTVDDAINDLLELSTSCGAFTEPGQSGDLARDLLSSGAISGSGTHDSAGASRLHEMQRAVLEDARPPPEWCAICLLEMHCEPPAGMHDARPAGGVSAMREELPRAVVELECSHAFHRRCLRAWCVEKPPGSCPLCRAAVQVKQVRGRAARAVRGRQGAAVL